MIDANPSALHRGDAGIDCGTRRQFAFQRRVGVNDAPGLEEPAMFKLPAYDPVGIAMLGFGILAIVALAFTF